MLQRYGRLARTTLRAMLMIGGALGAWGVHNATAEEAAYAVGSPRSCGLGELLDGTLRGSPLSCASDRATGSPGEPVPDAPAGDPTATPKPTGGTRAPARTAVPVRPPTGERSTTVRAPAGRAVDATAATAVAKTVEAARPLTRPVTDLAAPVVRRTTATGLLEPVGTVVLPVARPVVEALVPALAPVLDLVDPIVGPPTAPVPPPHHPVDVAPAPDGKTPTVTAPAAVARPTSVPPSTVTLRPTYRPAAPTWAPAAASRSTPATTGETAGRRHAVPSRTVDVTPAAFDSTAGNGSTGAGAGAATAASTRSWTPEWRPQGCSVTRREDLADRARQPDTRPA